MDRQHLWALGRRQLITNFGRLNGIDVKSRSFYLTVGILVVAVHTYALLTFGATFWVDSRAYVALADAMRSQQGLVDFYHQGGRWIFGHIQPGLSVLWLGLTLLPEPLRWPVLAIVQHSVAAFALIFAFRTINRYWPSPLHLICLLVVLLLPAYQAFHNALLTESLTSSLFLVAFATCLRVGFEDRVKARDIWLALVTILLVTQFRSYWGAIITLMMAASLLKRRLVFSVWMPLLIAVALGAAAAFPLYRYCQTGEFFLPQGAMNSLITGLQVNPHPSDRVRAAFDAADLPPSAPESVVLSKGLDLRAAMDIGRQWRAAGLDDSAINARAEQLGKILAGDGFDVQVKRAIYGIASLGSVMVFDFGDPDREIFRGMTMRGMVKHQRYYYEWFEWISKEDYGHFLSEFFVPNFNLTAFPFDNEAGIELHDAMKNYLSPLPSYFRNVLAIGSLPPDVWLVLGLIAFAYLLACAPFIALLFAIAVSVCFVTAFSFPVGDTRYANPLLPFYLVNTSIALGIFVNRLRRPTTGDPGTGSPQNVGAEKLRPISQSKNGRR